MKWLVYPLIFALGALAFALLSGYSFTPPASRLASPPASPSLASPASSPASPGFANMANPASVYCGEQGGTLKIIDTETGELGLCEFADYSCEEWVFYRGECNIEADQAALKTALLAKGLDLTGMEVKINRHLGQYIGASVVPVSVLGGGGYVFAARVGGELKIVADGNGAIMCDSLVAYPSYPPLLIPECLDFSGNPIKR